MLNLTDNFQFNSKTLSLLRDVYEELNILNLKFKEALEAQGLSSVAYFWHLECIEADASSRIEGICIKNSQIFLLDFKDFTKDFNVQQVLACRDSLKKGYSTLQENGGLLTSNVLVGMVQTLKKDSAGFRKLPGTAIVNGQGKVVYTPPQSYEEIRSAMQELEVFINTDTGLDPLLKVALIHYQFESIHPFYDGNGRVGRALMSLYLWNTGKVILPWLPISVHIFQTRSNYYKMLSGVRSGEISLDHWCQYILESIVCGANVCY